MPRIQVIYIKKDIMWKFVLICLMNIVFFISNYQLFAFFLSDTGQSKCYDNETEIKCPKVEEPFFGQDANYLINPISLIKLDKMGNNLPMSATSWSMVMDNNTGLTWEVKVNDNDSIHYMKDQYSSNEIQSINFFGVKKGILSKINSTQFGGFNDWRLPQTEEFLSIINFGCSNPSINTDFFPNTQSNFYLLFEYQKNKSYGINFNYGNVKCFNFKNNLYNVRFVRGNSINLLGRFIQNRKTVKDTRTGLIWQKENKKEMTWKESLKYCENLYLSNRKDWRLPTIKELMSIVDFSSNDPAINRRIFSETKSVHYWSSTTYEDNPTYAWTVNFFDGSSSYYSGKLSKIYVRAVTSGKNNKNRSKEKLLTRLNDIQTDNIQQTSKTSAQKHYLKPDPNNSKQEYNEFELPENCFTNKYAIAIIIGNKDYEKTTNVNYAINDATRIKELLIKTLGYKIGNILFYENARKGDFETLFGTSNNYKGKLYNSIKPMKSEIFIYYSGHGAFGTTDSFSYFVPIEVDPHYVELSGYSLSTLYKNLNSIQAKKITIILDCCFSGNVKNVSPIIIKDDSSNNPLRNGIIITSSKGNQYSNWYPEKKHGLFTYFFLKAVNNYNADYNSDDSITYQELFSYISDSSEGIPYFSRLLNDLEQIPSIYGETDKIFIRNFKCRH